MKAYCNQCAGYRSHVLLATADTAWEETVDEYGNTLDGTSLFELLRCCGCDDVHLRHYWEVSEEYRGPDHEGPVITRYPPKRERHTPVWLDKLPSSSLADGAPKGLWVDIHEIYTAVDAGALRLAVMGIRALLETVMIDKVSDNGSFGGNLAALEGKGLISATQRQYLRPAIELGHATMHRGYRPPLGDVHAMLDVVESLMYSLYIVPMNAKPLEKRLPPRKPRLRKIDGGRPEGV